MSDRYPRRWPPATPLGVAVPAIALMLALVLAACGPAEGVTPPIAGGVTIGIDVTGLGRVGYPEGGLECSRDCRWSVPGDRAVALVAVPQSHHVFAGWGEPCDVFANPCQTTFDEGDRVAATFAPHALRLRLTGDGAGVFSISGAGPLVGCDADCFVAMDMPLLVSITAQEDADTVLGDWTGPCDPAHTEPNYCLVPVSGLTEVGKSWYRPPTAADDAYETAPNVPLVVAAPGVLGNDTPAGALRAELVTNVGDGDLTLLPDGGFDYVPRPGFEGVDGFTYRVRNDRDQTATASVTITVRSDATAPTAVDDEYVTFAGLTLLVAAPGVLGSDEPGSSGAVEAELVADVSGGDLALSPDGSFVYTSKLGFAGIDTFTYRAVAGTVASVPATVSIEVRTLRGSAGAP